MKHLTKLKSTKRFAYMNKLGSQAVQDIAQRIDRAYNFFWNNQKRKVKSSPPKFKKVRRYKSFTLKQAGWKLDETRGRIKLGKKWYGYFKSRNIEGKIKTVTVKRDAVGDIAVICLEDLNIKAMARLWGRKIHSLGFSEFVKILQYEAMKSGTRIVSVDRYYPSSQLCSVCGYKNEAVKDLKIREWDCPSCHTHHDRDKNAAKNILMAGTSAISGDTARPEKSGSVVDARIPRL